MFSINIRLITTAVLIAVVSLSYLFPQEKEVFIPNSSTQVIYGRITDEKGNPVTAQVSAWTYPLVPTSFDPSEGPVDNLVRMTYSNSKGFFSFRVPADTIMVFITKGPEWSVIKKQFIVKEKEFDGIEFNVQLKKLYNLESLGWYGGDTHHHSFFSDGFNSPSEVAAAMQAVGLSWGMLTDHNSDAGIKEWLAERTDSFIPIHGCEITTEPADNSVVNGYGHINQTFITEMNGTDASNPNIWARERFSDHTDVQKMIDLTHKQNGLISLNHPFQNWDWTGRFKSWGKVKGFDAFEVWNGEPPHSFTYNDWDTNHTNINTWALHAWFEYLDNGNKITAIAGSDAHDIYGVNAYPKTDTYWTITSGNPRTYCRMDKLSEENIYKSIKNGNAFLTSTFGPLLIMKVNGAQPGEILEILKEDKLKINIQVLSNQPLPANEHSVRLIFNGEIIKEFKTDAVLTLTDSASVTVQKDGWLVCEAFGQWPAYAVTNPVYIDYPPYGDSFRTYKEPAEAEGWNKFLNHPAVKLPDGSSSWKDSKDSIRNINK
jgi:hypothetical protein